MTSAASPEIAPLLPLSPEHVVESLKFLEQSSDGMLNLILAARDPEGKGPISDFYGALPLDELSKWHEERGDHEQEVLDLYRIGLIYGTDMALSAAKDTDFEDTPNPAFYPTEFGKSIDYLKKSYDDNQYVQSQPWKRERYRELAYAGSDILSLANAGLYNAVKKKLEERKLDTYENQTAQLTGLIDGVIAVDAFRKFTKGFEPRPLDTDPLDRSIRSNESVEPAYGELKTLDDVIELIELSRAERYVMPIADGARLATRTTTRQVGANLFFRGLEDEAVVAPKILSKSLGLFAVSGAIPDVTNFFISNLDGEISKLDYLPVASAASMTIYGFIYWCRRLLAKREAIERNVPLISPGEYKKRYEII